VQTHTASAFKLWFRNEVERQAARGCSGCATPDPGLNGLGYALPERCENPAAPRPLAHDTSTEADMKFINLLTLCLVIVGGVNWGLVGLAQFDLVAAIFGAGSSLSRLVYILVGASAVYQLIPFFKAMSTGEVAAEADVPRRR
jgi:uncharacterized protein